LTALSFYLVSAATVAFVPRYHHPTDPMMHVVAAAGVMALVRILSAVFPSIRRNSPSVVAGASARQ
jgi:hypothetical protein